jgi:hypothetical protein
MRWSNEIEYRTQQKRRQSDSNTDYMNHKDNGNESDPLLGAIRAQNPG